jgi:predicted DCC family thiol-disulfide oxidoreductase YuxK
MHTNPTITPSGRRPTIYYNSACPVCDAGVCAMKSRTSGENAEWIDVHQAPELLTPLGLKLEDVRERLHMVDTDGRVQVGAPAIAAAWSLQSRWGWLAKPMSWYGLRTLSEWAYDRFARQLYRWNRRQGNF